MHGFLVIKVLRCLYYYLLLSLHGGRRPTKTMTVAPPPPADPRRSGGPATPARGEGRHRRRCALPSSLSLPGPPTGRYALVLNEAPAGAVRATPTWGGSLAEVARVPLAMAQRPSPANDRGKWRCASGRSGRVDVKLRAGPMHEGMRLVIFK